MTTTRPISLRGHLTACDNRIYIITEMAFIILNVAVVIPVAGRGSMERESTTWSQPNPQFAVDSTRFHPTRNNIAPSTTIEYSPLYNISFSFFFLPPSPMMAVAIRRAPVNCYWTDALLAFAWKHAPIGRTTCNERYLLYMFFSGGGWRVACVAYVSIHVFVCYILDNIALLLQCKALFICHSALSSAFFFFHIWLDRPYPLILIYYL